MLQSFLSNPKAQFASAFGACIVLTAVTAVVAGNSSPNYSVTLRLAHTRTAGSLSDLTAYKFKELLEQNSNGTMTVTIYPSNGLTGGDQMRSIDMLKEGSIDVQISNASTFSTIDKRFEAFAIPYLFENEDQVKFIINDEDARNTFSQWLSAEGLELVAMYSEGPRQLTNNVKEIKTPDDLKGLLIRANPIEVVSDTYSVLGATPVKIDAAGVGHALEQQSIQGQDSTIATFVSANFYENQKYVTKWNATYDTQMWVGNIANLDKLTEQQKIALQKSADEAVAWGNNLADNFNKLYSKSLADKGVAVTELTEEELAAFKSALYPVFANYYDTLGADTFKFFLTHRGVEGVEKLPAGDKPVMLAQAEEPAETEAAPAETAEAAEATEAPAETQVAAVETPAKTTEAAETQVAATETPAKTTEAAEAAEATEATAETQVAATETPVEATEATEAPAETQVAAAETPVEATEVAPAETQVAAVETPAETAEVAEAAEATEAPAETQVAAVETPAKTTEAAEAAEATEDSAKTQVAAVETPAKTTEADEAAEATEAPAETQVAATETPAKTTEAAEAAKATEAPSETQVAAAETPADTAEVAEAAEATEAPAETQVAAAETPVEATEVAPAETPVEATEVAPAETQVAAVETPKTEVVTIESTKTSEMDKASDTVAMAKVVPAEPVTKATSDASEDAVLAQVEQAPVPVAPAPAPVKEVTLDPAPVIAAIKATESAPATPAAPAKTVVPAQPVAPAQTVAAAGFAPQQQPVQVNPRVKLDQPSVVGFQPIYEQYPQVQGFAPVVVDHPNVAGFNNIVATTTRHVAPPKADPAKRAPVQQQPVYVQYAPVGQQGAIQCTVPGAVPGTVPAQGQIIEIAPGQYVQLVPVQPIQQVQVVPVQSQPQYQYIQVVPAQVAPAPAPAPAAK